MSPRFIPESERISTLVLEALSLFGYMATGLLVLLVLIWLIAKALVWVRELHREKQKHPRIRILGWVIVVLFLLAVAGSIAGKYSGKHTENSFYHESDVMIIIAKPYPVRYLELSGDGIFEGRVGGYHRYAIPGEDFSFELGGGAVLEILADPFGPFDAKAITIIGKRAAYAMEIDQSSCAGDPQTCGIKITSRPVTKDERSPMLKRIEGRITNTEEMLRVDSQFVYFGTQRDARVQVLTNYGRYAANLPACLTGQKIGPIRIGPQELFIDCTPEGKVLRAEVDASTSTPSYRFVDAELVDTGRPWGSGAWKDGYVLSDADPGVISECPVITDASSRGQTPTQNCRLELAETLQICEKTGDSGCFYDVATKGRTIELCDRIPPKDKVADDGRRGTIVGGSGRQSCYYHVATQSYDAGICLRMSRETPWIPRPTNPRNHCLSLIAQETRNPEICADVPDGARSACIASAGGVPPSEPKPSSASRTLTYRIEESETVPEAYAVTFDSDAHVFPEGAWFTAAEGRAYTENCGAKISFGGYSPWFIWPLSGADAVWLPETAVVPKGFTGDLARTWCVQLWKDKDFTQPLSKPAPVIFPERPPT